MQSSLAVDVDEASQVQLLQNELRQLHVAVHDTTRIICFSLV